DFGLWGDRAVTGMHVQSIVLYAFMVLACYGFLRRLLQIFHDDEEEGYLWAAMASVLYAVHPVHVESVAWLFARKEPLLGIFTFLSLWAFIEARVTSWWYYLPCLATLVLAVLAKPTALVAPAVMFVLDLAIQKRRPDPAFWKKRLFVYLPMLAFTVPMAYRLVDMMQEAGGVKPYHGGGFWTNLLAVSQIFVSYIKLAGFTVNYSADYPIPLYTDPFSWRPWVYVAVNVILLASAVYAFMRKRLVYAFFVAWHYLFVLPVSHVFPIAQIMADRYALLPSLSWCVLVGYLLAKLWTVRKTVWSLSPGFFTALSVGLFCFVTLFYAYMTFRQNDIWQNSQSLWEDTLAKYPDSSPANVNLAAIYIKQGRPLEAQELAIRAIRVLPYDYLAISNLALAQVMMGQYDNAISNYKAALRLKPSLIEARMGLAHAYWEKGDYENAYSVYMQLYQEGVVAGSRHAPTMYFRLGYMTWKYGDPRDARAFLAAAEPGLRGDLFKLSELAGVYTSMNDFRNAYRVYRTVYDRLEEGEPKAKLARLLSALEKKMRQ
ncbi:MAG TPA: tetratricopeptide repeat protein, partial [Deltaproteobacteria bacterium]|nr:tetratricopeptide repeat protein [Deltaproteobacteria bacterium]